MALIVTDEDNMSSTESISSDTSSDVETKAMIKIDYTESRKRRRPPSILILGASSRTGLECIQQLSQHPSRPYVHAFNEEDVPEMDDDYFNMCHTVIEGSMRHAIDIEDALNITGAKWVVLCNDHDTEQRRPKDHFTVRTKNVVHVLEQPQFASVRILSVSRIEAVTPKAEMNKCALLNFRSKLRQMKCRPILQDFARQEKQLHTIWDRSTVVRTTRLTDSSVNNNNISRRSLAYSDDELMKSVKSSRDNCRLTAMVMERVDLASYIVDEICARPTPTGNRVINVVSTKI